jgi:hypothetical protein
VHPTALVARAREDLLERLPQAETTVTDDEVWCHRKPTPLDVDEEGSTAISGPIPRPPSRGFRRGAA